MKAKWILYVGLIAVAGLVIQGCGREPESSVSQSEEDGPAGQLARSAGAAVLVFEPGPDMHAAVQEALIEAEAGAVIQFEEGTFEFELGLSLDVDNVTIRGRGIDKTILSFKNQEGGSEGLYVTSDNVLLEDFAVVDTKGNAIKSHGANNIVFRRVRTEWTGGPKSTNGAYGIYPVSSRNVLVEECVSIGASDAGIYVGQSENVIVRNSRAEYNVAGFEIENCHGADVYENVATNNAGGILVFDLPDLPVQRGGDVRVFKNQAYANNTKNFAPEGNIVANVPTGTGVMIMANSNVEIFENEIWGNDTTNLVLTSYLITGNAIKDPNYYPYAEKVHVHHNTFGPGGTNPGKEGVSPIVAMIVGTPIPDIIWDGIVNPEKVKEGELDEDARIYIHDNNKTGGGDVTFANLGGLASLANPAEGKALVTRDLGPHRGSFPSLHPILIKGAG